MNCPGGTKPVWESNPMGMQVEMCKPVVEPVVAEPTKDDTAKAADICKDKSGLSWLMCKIFR